MRPFKPIMDTPLSPATNTPPATSPKDTVSTLSRQDAPDCRAKQVSLRSRFRKLTLSIPPVPLSVCKQEPRAPRPDVDDIATAPIFWQALPPLSDTDKAMMDELNTLYPLHMLYCGERAFRVEDHPIYKRLKPLIAGANQYGLRESMSHREMIFNVLCWTVRSWLRRDAVDSTINYIRKAHGEWIAGLTPDERRSVAVENCDEEEDVDISPAFGRSCCTTCLHLYNLETSKVNIDEDIYANLRPLMLHMDCADDTVPVAHVISPLSSQIRSYWWNILFIATRFDDAEDDKKRSEATEFMLQRLPPELQNFYKLIQSDIMSVLKSRDYYAADKLFYPLKQFVEHHLSIEFKDPIVTPILLERGLITAWDPPHGRDMLHKIRNFRERSEWDLDLPEDVDLPPKKYCNGHLRLIPDIDDTVLGKDYSIASFKPPTPCKRASEAPDTPEKFRRFAEKTP